MRKKINILFVLLIMPCMIISGCTSDSGVGNGDPTSFAQAAIQSLPQTHSQQGGVASAFIASVSSGVNITEYSKLDSFFEQECFMPDGDNYCPAGVDTSGGDTNPRKFTSYTLLGMIYHAEMYSGGQHTSCDQGSAATIDATSLVPLTLPSSDVDKFLLDYYSLLGCLYEDPSSDATSKQYTAYSSDANGEYQATLTTRNRVPYNGITDPGQNDIFQVYVSKTDGLPKFLALNYAGADTVFSRTILLVNLTDNKFVVKHSSFNGSGYDTVVSAGVGGVDRATGVANTGYYMVKFTDGGSELEKCVNNTTGMIDIDMTNCTDASIPASGTWSSNAVQTYLGMTDTQATHLAAWLTKLADATAMGAADTPTNADLGGDPDLFFPRLIQDAP